MTKNLATYTQKVNKRGRIKKKISFFFVLLFIIVFSLLIVNFADIFSSIITSRGSLIYGTKIRIPSKVFYAITLYDAQSKENAESVCMQVSKSGGAGEIYLNGDYYVVASIYASHTDADNVKQTLIEDGTECKILNINIPVMNLEYSGKNDEVLVQGFESFTQTYTFLYDLSIDYDSGKCTTTEVKSEIAKQISKLSQLKSEILKVYQNEKIEFENNLLSAMNVCIDELNAVLLSSTTDFGLNSQIKKAYCKILFEYQKLAKTL